MHSRHARNIYDSKIKSSFEIMWMKKLILMASLLGVLQACTVARVAGGAAVGAGRLALGAVDVVL